MKIMIPSRLSDSELVAEVGRLARSERQATALLVAHLAELDLRRLHLAAGFRSLFMYCREILELSEQSAYNRIVAAHAARDFPVVLDMLNEAALTLATLRLVAPHLTADNHQELLAAASHQSKRQVEKLLARRFPQPDVTASIRRLRRSAQASPSGLLAQPNETQPCASTDGGKNLAAVKTETPAAGAPAEGSEVLLPSSAILPATGVSSLSAPSASAGMTTSAVLAHAEREPSHFVIPTPRPATVRPLAEDRFEVRFTAPARTCDKLELARDLLRHAVPTGDMAEVIDRALTLLLEDLARKRFAATEHPRKGEPTGTGSRHIPAAVKRAVWMRDQGRCRFTGTGGRRCDARGFLEFHHVQPFASGGEATADNIELRCRAHNSYEAELYFGFCPASVPDDRGAPRAALLAPGQVRAQRPVRPRSGGQLPSDQDLKLTDRIGT